MRNNLILLREAKETGKPVVVMDVTGKTYTGKVEVLDETTIPSFPAVKILMADDVAHHPDLRSASVSFA